MNNLKLMQTKSQVLPKSKTIKIRFEYNNSYKKPFIGGNRDLISNKVYLHAFSQTNQKKKEHAVMFERETQTKETINKACNVKREFGTQTSRKDLFIDNRKVTVTIDSLETNSRSKPPKNISRLNCGSKEEKMLLCIFKKCSKGFWPE